MITCKRFRVEVYRCPPGNFHVAVQPVEYLGREEFKAWMRLCKRNFMALTSRKPWVFENAFNSYTDAVLFVKSLCRQLGELAFFDRTKAQVQLATPKEENGNAM